MKPFKIIKKDKAEVWIVLAVTDNGVLAKEQTSNELRFIYYSEVEREFKFLSFMEFKND